MAFLTDETQGFRTFFSNSMPEYVVMLHPESLTDTPAAVFRPPTHDAPASICVVEAPHHTSASSSDDALTTFFDGQSYFCGRECLPDSQRHGLEQLAGHPVMLYLVCVHRQGTRTYYQAQADLAECLPSSYRFALHAATPAPSAVHPPPAPRAPGAYPPPVQPRYRPPSGPYPPQPAIPQVAHQHAHHPGAQHYPPPETLAIPVVPAFPGDRPAKRACAWSTNWTLFCLGFIFPPFWIIAMVRGSGMVRGASSADNTAAMASFFALLAYVVILVPVYYKFR